MLYDSILDIARLNGECKCKAHRRRKEAKQVTQKKGIIIVYHKVMM